MRLFKRSRSAKAESHQQQEATRPKSGPLHEKHREQEYAYVPSKYGYDYAPPSLLVPSHSVDSSTVQHHLSNMLYEEQPVSQMSGNSTSSYYKKKQSRDPAAEALRQHQAYEEKYQKSPILPSHGRQIMRQHQDLEAKYHRAPPPVPMQRSSGSKSHWRPSEKEHRQRLSEQQRKQRAQRVQEPPGLHNPPVYDPPPQAPPQSYREQRDPAVPNPYQSTVEDVRDTVEPVPTLQNTPSIDSGLQFAREQSRRSRYSLGDSVTANSHRSSNSHQRTRPSPTQQRGPPSQTRSVASSQRSNHQSSRQPPPIQPIQPMLPNQPVQQIHQPIPLRSHHSIDNSTITTQPDAFRRSRALPPHEQQGTYYRKYESRRNAQAATGQPHDQHILNYHPSNQHKSGGASNGTSARERKRNIERSYNDYLMRERGWVPTAFVAADIVQASKQNKIVAAREAKRKEEGVPKTRMYSGPASHAVSKSTAPKVEPKKEETRVPIAPIVPLSPKKKGFFKKMFGRGNKSNKKSKKSTKKTSTGGSSAGSKKRPPRIQVDPPSKGTIRGVNPAKSGNSASTRDLSYSTASGGKNKQPKQIYIPPPTQVPKIDDATPMEMSVARSKTSSHKVYGKKTLRDFKDAGQLYPASSDRHIISQVQKQLQEQKQKQQQSTGGSSQQSSKRAPNTIFFPDTTRNSTAGSSHSRHSADVSTKFYSTGTGGSTLQSRQSSYPSNHSGSRVNTGQSSSFDRRQPHPSTSRSNSTYDQYWRQAHNSLVSSRLSRSNSHQGILKHNRSGDSDWKRDPRMPDPWAKPTNNVNVVVRGNHRGHSNRELAAKGALVANNNALFNFGCV